MPVAEDSAHVPVFPPAIYLLALGVGFLLQRLVPLPLGSGWRVVGWVLIVLGLIFVGSAAGLFFRAGTTPNPTKPTTALVFDGPYRLTRNPMYLGLTLITSGIGLAAQTLWPLVLALVAGVVTQRVVIVREERYLEQKFGAAYLDYKRRVRRWL